MGGALYRDQPYERGSAVQLPFHIQRNALCYAPQLQRCADVQLLREGCMNHISRFPSGALSAPSHPESIAVADPRDKDSGSPWALTAFFAAMVLILIVSAFLVEAIR